MLTQKSCGGSVIDPLTPQTRCFLETRIPDEASEPTARAFATPGFGSLRMRTYDLRALANEGDSGGGIEDWHSAWQLDADGVPVIPGSYTDTNPTAFAASGTDARGAGLEWGGAVYRPVYVPAGMANAGAEIASMEIYDAYTATNHSDRQSIWVGQVDGQPSLDRSSLTEVAAGQQGTAFTLPERWAGHWARLKLFLSDRGGTTQVNWRVRLRLADGTVMDNQDMRRFLMHEDAIEQITPPLYEQRLVQATIDPATGSQDWTINGEAIDPAVLQELQPIADDAGGCTYLPMQVTADVINGVVTATASLGAPGDKLYQFWPGGPWAAENTYRIGDTGDDSEVDIRDIRVRVRDAAGLESNIVGAGVLVGDPTDLAASALRVADAVANNNLNAIVSTDPELPGGWWTDYGTRLAYDDAPVPADWGTGNGLSAASGWMRFGAGVNYVGGMSAERCFPAGEAGAPGAFVLDLYSYYYAVAANNIVIDLKAVDQVTGAELGIFRIRDNDNDPAGEANLVWPENTARNNPDQTLEFVHTGNPICLRIEDTTQGPDTDARGHYWRLKDVEYWQGNRQSAANHFWRINAYVEARGINRAIDVDEPATLNIASVDISAADHVVIEGRIDRFGTLNDDDRIAIQYRLDGGEWVDALVEVGNLQAAGRTHLTPRFELPVYGAESADLIEVRAAVWGSGRAVGYRVYNIAVAEVAA